MDAFYHPDDAGGHALSVVATPLTRGPWDNRFQHGGPPCALLAGALDRFGEDAEDWFLARLTVELLRPVPIGPLQVSLHPGHLGRTVQRLEARLHAGDTELGRARGLRMRRTDLGADGAFVLPPAAPWPDPETCEPLRFHFFRHEVGYHRAVDLRVVHGEWGRTPIGLWTRPTVPLVAGRPTSALERLVTLADAQSGMGVPLDPQRWKFVNPDVNVFLERDPRESSPWLGFDIRTTASGHGSGLSQSEVRDAEGVVARTIQTLVVGPRDQAPSVRAGLL